MLLPQYLYPRPQKVALINSEGGSIELSPLLLHYLLFSFVEFYQNRENIQSYVDACRIRISRTKSRKMQITYRRVYKTLENFNLYRKYPSGIYARTSARRGSYRQLNPVFREVVDIYKDTGEKRGLKDTTIYKTSFSAFSFLLAMQKRGKAALNDITEDDVISYFIREGGGCRDTYFSLFPYPSTVSYMSLKISCSFFHWFVTDSNGSKSFSEKT